MRDMTQLFACYEIASYVVEATGFFEDKILGGLIHFSNHEFCFKLSKKQHNIKQCIQVQIVLPENICMTLFKTQS